MTILDPSAESSGAPPVRNGREGHAPKWLLTPVLQLEETTSLTAAIDKLQLIADRVMKRPALASALKGEPIGHAAHPLLTDFPLGCWMSASLLDFLGGRRSRPAATMLMGLGVAMAVPTAATGLAEWSSAGTRAQRVGVVHAAVNLAAGSLYALSFASRLLGRHKSGVKWGLAGGSIAWIGGYLGGHLTLVMKVGTADPAFGSDAPSA
jgi:uncharacterized membrane protein